MGRPFSLLPVTKICKYCKVPFLCTKATAIKTQVFHDRFCRSKWVGERKRAKRIKRKCGTCGKVMCILPCHLKTKHFCSYKCTAAAKPKGSGNPAWKGGTSTYWKRQCRKRDGGVCRCCGRKASGKQFHAHHIVPRIYGGTDQLSNLIGLCEMCHGRVEKTFYDKVLSVLPPGTLEAFATEVQAKFHIRGASNEGPKSKASKQDG